MANSKYEYVKSYEVNDRLMPLTWIVVKIKLSDFQRFAEVHEFKKPNDGFFLDLMNKSAVSMLKEYPDIIFAYGINDEYSFVFKKTTQFYKRRASKVVSVVMSFFVSSYNMLWNDYFPEKELKYGPSFIGRLFCCPSSVILRDYLSWRQVNGYVKNWYNYLFWMLVESGKSKKEVHNLLEDVKSQGTNGLLAQQFGKDYHISSISNIGSCVHRKKKIVKGKIDDGNPLKRSQNEVIVAHCDMTSSTFWKEHENIFRVTFCEENRGILKDDLAQCLGIAMKLKYMKVYEVEDTLMPCAWIVLRIDGCHFHRFSYLHEFEKPNDQQALKLMNACAVSVLEEFPDVVFSYGVSDEYSFIFKKTTEIYKRRASNIISHLVSLFSSMYVMKWKEFFPLKKLKYPPSFDGRAVCYPSDAILRDYLSWRQVDCHINNHYNTCFWMLVQNGKSKSEAQCQLKGTQAQEKTELLRQFGINYEMEPDMFRKGSCVFRQKDDMDCVEINGGQDCCILRANVSVKHCDIIDPSFWEAHPDILDESKDPLLEAANGFSQYLESFEVNYKLMPSTWIVVKINICNFQRFSELHGFEKPNDEQSWNLMNTCAIALQMEFIDTVFSYGFNDEYSFVFKKTTQFAKRCASSIKLFVALFFSRMYFAKWKEFFPHKELKVMPIFSADIYCCPTFAILRAYLAWRQEECHICNLHQTCLWMMVKCGKSVNEAEDLLKDSTVGDKNELLFQHCGINYNTCSPMFRKGSCTFRFKVGEIEKMSKCNHCDISRPSFWNKHTEVFDENKSLSSEISDGAERMQSFEVKDYLVPSTWIVVALDISCLCSSKKSDHKQELDLLHACAVAVLEEFADIILLYNFREEYGFIFKKTTQFHGRNYSKMELSIAHVFWSAYVTKGKEFFPQEDVTDLPVFSWRVFCYPSASIIQNYLAWKEDLFLMNNWGNSCFRLLVKCEYLKVEAENIKGEEIMKVNKDNRLMELLHEQMIFNHSNVSKCGLWKEFSNVLDFQRVYPDLLRD